MLQLLLRDEALAKRSLGASVIGFHDFGFGLPIFQIVFDAAGFGARGFEIGGDLAVVELRKQGAGFYPRAGLDINFGDHALALRGNFDLMLNDQRAGSREAVVERRWHGTRRRGGRRACRGYRRGRGRGGGGGGGGEGGGRGGGGGLSASAVGFGLAATASQNHRERQHKRIFC